MLWIVLIAVIIIAFAAFVYKQDESQFTKLTNYSSFDLMFNQEARKLNAIYNAAQQVSGEKEILLNVHVPSESDVYKIPAVLLHESGIYVITNNDAEGWIVGSDRGLEWSSIRYKKDKIQFENPILHNRRHVYALRDNMVELPDEAFESIVLFNNSSSFQRVEISSMNADVLKYKELKQWAKSLEGNKLTKQDIETIYASLKDKMEFEKSVVMKKEVNPVA